MVNYADAGVDVKLGDNVSEILYNASKLTWENRRGKLGEVIVPFDDFSGLRYIDVSKLVNDTVMGVGFDGVGTKIEIAERVGGHDTIAYDLFAMICDDAVARGAEPVLVGSILDVNSLKDKNKNPFLYQVRELANGYINAAREAGVAVVNGEVAELGVRVQGYGDFNYNWGAGVVWFAKKDRLFTGKEIKEGDHFIGLKEEGFRSNGLSLVREVLKTRFGNNWHNSFDDSDFQIGSLSEKILKPSRIYTRAIIDMIGSYSQESKVEIHGIAHITGGGIPEKLGRVLKPSGLGAIINNVFTPPAIMLYTQSLGNVSDEEAYRTWNMGQGMIVITPDPGRVIDIIDENHEIQAKHIGFVTKKSEIKIISKGFYSSGEELVF